MKIRNLAFFFGLLFGGCGASTQKGTPDLSAGAPGPDLAVPASVDLASAPPVDSAGQSGFNTDAACAQVSAQATLTKRPVDIIFTVDNSGSMTAKIVAVQNNINQNFAQIIGASGLDYRVIMIAKYGTAWLDQSICISAPLSGNMCPNPPGVVFGKPMNTKNFFQYSTEIGSHDSFARILGSYNAPDPNGQGPGGFSDWLRKDSLKVFIEITDDSSDMMASDFEKQLFAKVPALFGDANNRLYSWYSIVGLKENNPPTKPWEPMDPLQMDKCTKNNDAVNNGIEYQKLSVLTGGLRFPICEHASFDAVFKAVAAGVVSGAVVACDFPVPNPPPGQKIDLKTVVVDYTQGGAGQPQMFKQVPGVGQCAPDSFYIDNGRIFLCPDACAKVKADSKAKVDVLFDCDGSIG